MVCDVVTDGFPSESGLPQGGPQELVSLQNEFKMFSAEAMAASFIPLGSLWLPPSLRLTESRQTKGSLT